MSYHEDVVFYKTESIRQHNKPVHSEVALEDRQCITETTKDQESYPEAHQIRHRY